MTYFPGYIAARLSLAILTGLLTISALAQQPLPRTTIFLDPAHGGPDNGALLPDHILEKNLTLTFASRLRTALSAAGFLVISSHDSDPVTPLTTDQRAEIANHAHPSACLVIHATASGNGIHIITSALPPPSDTDDPDALHPAIPWETAQSASIPQSLKLANALGAALIQAKFPVLLTQASIRPLDNLTCPAVAIEIAPLTRSGADTIPVTEATYQQLIAQVIATALTTRRSQTAAAGAGR